ncbi:hypothetical protein EDC01DRAFT_634140 [Geopyxis carbonaria]|nr:hypothetical protein EDC01DRAFT_634140 [Geopyxis carbonaria]
MTPQDNGTSFERVDENCVEALQQRMSKVQLGSRNDAKHEKGSSDGLTHKILKKSKSPDKKKTKKVQNREWFDRLKKLGPPDGVVVKLKPTSKKKTQSPTDKKAKRSVKQEKEIQDVVDSSHPTKHTVRNTEAESQTSCDVDKPQRDALSGKKKMRATTVESETISHRSTRDQPKLVRQRTVERISSGSESERELSNLHAKDRNIATPLSPCNLKSASPSNSILINTAYIQSPQSNARMETPPVSPAKLGSMAAEESSAEKRKRGPEYFCFAKLKRRKNKGFERTG